ncbi:unnamed protein product, partial [Prorocentrum cordatum]
GLRGRRRVRRGAGVGPAAGGRSRGRRRGAVAGPPCARGGAAGACRWRGELAGAWRAGSGGADGRRAPAAGRGAWRRAGPSGSPRRVQDLDGLAAAAAGATALLLLADPSTPPAALGSAWSGLEARFPAAARVGAVVAPPAEKGSPALAGFAGALQPGAMVAVALGAPARAAVNTCGYEPFGQEMEVFEASLPRSGPCVVQTIGTDKMGSWEDAEETEKGTAGIARRVSVPAARAVQDSKGGRRGRSEGGALRSPRGCGVGRGAGADGRGQGVVDIPAPEGWERGPWRQGPRRRGPVPEGGAGLHALLPPRRRARGGHQGGSPDGQRSVHGRPGARVRGRAPGGAEGPARAVWPGRARPRRLLADRGGGRHREPRAWESGWSARALRGRRVEEIWGGPGRSSGRRQPPVSRGRVATVGPWPWPERPSLRASGPQDRCPESAQTSGSFARLFCLLGLPRVSRDVAASRLSGVVSAPAAVKTRLAAQGWSCG